MVLLQPCVCTAPECGHGSSNCGADNIGYRRVPYPLKGVCVQELFSEIAGGHLNVNAAHEHREAQRLRMKRGASIKDLLGISIGRRMAEIKENYVHGNDGACRSLVPVVHRTMRRTQFG